MYILNISLYSRNWEEECVQDLFLSMLLTLLRLVNFVSKLCIIKKKRIIEDISFWLPVISILEEKIACIYDLTSKSTRVKFGLNYFKLVSSLCRLDISMDITLRIGED